MLEQLAEQQAAICAVLMEGKLRHLMPEGQEWSIIEELISILKPFQSATEAMSTQKYPSISSVKPLLFKLIEKTLKVDASDTSTARAIKEAVRSDLVVRYTDPSIENMITVTAYLDPRYKELPFLNKSHIIEFIEEELTGQYLLDEGDDDVIDLEGPPETGMREEGPMADLLGDVFNSSSSQKITHREKVMKEICLYNAEQPISKLDSDPLEWWQTRKHSYPLISSLVQKSSQ